MLGPIVLEGYAPDELLALPDEELRAWVLCDHPITFRIGTAEVLGQFRRTATTLTLELAQIEGGGEGVLPVLWTLAERYARENDLESVEWIVHAIHCARPNPKLRPLLQRKGFRIEQIAGIGEAYRLIRKVKASS